MVAVKNADVDRFIARPDPARSVVLVYGPDSGLVRERVETLVAGAVDDPRDPFSLARIEGDALADEPERLVEEAHTVPLFGGRRAVWVKAGGRNFTPAVERVLAAPPGADCRIVIEAGDLKRSAPLRAACERSGNAAALPCYADSTRDLNRLIDEEMREAGLTIAPDARAALADLIGGDRGTSRSELRKLALYARGKLGCRSRRRARGRDRCHRPHPRRHRRCGIRRQRPGPRDGDRQGAGERDRRGGAHQRGDPAGRDAPSPAAFRRAGALGGERRRGRRAVDPFQPQGAVQAALTAWSAKRLERLIGHLGDTALDTRQRANLAYPIVHRTLIDIARSARRRD